MRSFVIRAVLPAMLAIALFFGAMFGIVLPRLERVILDQKKAMIRELTNAAWNVLARHQHDEERGLVTRDEAQRQAVAQILDLHYGRQMKDYFWINDTHPRMIVHPYRPELNGQDLSNICDPDGVRLFVEFVQRVREHGAGYVTYRWQWQDDPSRVVPKISYVKGFAPWGWIIGTGVYLDDVRIEVREATHELMLVSAIILAIVTLLLSWLLWNHYGVEQRRRFAEHDLQQSEERYRLVVESTGENILMWLPGLPLFANQSLLRLLGYSLDELSQLRLDQIIAPTRAGSPGEVTPGAGPGLRGDGSPPVNETAAARAHPDWLHAMLQGERAPGRYEAALCCRDGSRRTVMISCSTVVVNHQAGVIMVATDITADRHLAVVRDQTVAELQGALMFLDRPVRELCRREIATCLPDQTLAEAAATAATHRYEVMLRQPAPDRAPTGVITTPTLLAELGRLPAAAERTVADLQGEPLITVDADASLAAAWLELYRHDFRPLHVTEADGRIVGVLTSKDLQQVQRASPALLLQEIAAAPDAAAMAAANCRLSELVRVFADSGARPLQINRLITQNADAVLARAIELAIARLGPPPVPFAFMVMGSEGRREQTLRTDQDNAIIYEDVANDPTVVTTAGAGATAPTTPPTAGPVPLGAQAWFERFGAEVCATLERCGYAACEGGIMASNRRWVLPASRWERQFSEWIRNGDAEDLLRVKIFFDFRAGAGQPTLTTRLREHLRRELADQPRFFFLLARNVLIAQPPLDLFGGFVVERSARQRGTLDIKSALALITDFARIYALRHGITATGTRERLAALRSLAVLTPQSHQEIAQAFDALMQLRFDTQLRALAAGRAPENTVAPDELTAIEQKMLAEVFTQISSFQVRLSLDFTGSMTPPA